TEFGEGIDAAVFANKPAVDIAAQNGRGAFDDGFQLLGTLRPGQQGRGAKNGVLPVGGHDRLAAPAADLRIAAPTLVLVEQARAALAVFARGGRKGREDHFHMAGGGDGEQPKTETPEEIAEARIVLAPLPVFAARAASQTSSQKAARLTPCMTSSRLNASFISHTITTGGSPSSTPTRSQSLISPLTAYPALSMKDFRGR